MDNNLENYNLLDNSSCTSNLNYNNKSYNNYQSWSNVGQSLIKISSVDEHGNIQTNNQDTSRLQRLTKPFATFGDVNLSWVKN
tara:strand:- start:286 stop:534 length:249 start_codon:yes stop_codon:yes gene_type:complete